MSLLALLLSCEPSATATLPDPVCVTPSGLTAFTEHGDEVGLTGVEGARITAVDFDGDGWTDLAVSRGDLADDLSADPPVRNNWLLRNDHGTFVDVTEQSGLRQRRTGGAGLRPGQVVAWGDVDNDGDLDAYTGLNDPGDDIAETSELMINQGDGTFALGPRSDLRVRDGDVPSGAAFTDFDRDGLLDLWVSQGSVNGTPQQDRLWRGDGAGGFVDANAGVVSFPWMDVNLNLGLAHTNAWSAAACDVNNDGRPDLLAASYGRAPNHLWIQEPDGMYSNQSVLRGYAWDGNTDWSDNESARCYCKLNRDAEDCADVPEPALTRCDSPADILRWNHSADRMPYRLGGNSGATVCADVDNDGDLDLLTTEIRHWDVGQSSDASELLLNDGTGTFTRPGNEATGLLRDHGDMIDWNDGDITAAVLDADLDGWPDLWVGSTDYPGTRGHLFHQVEPGRWEDVPPRQGLDVGRAHGVVVADFDRDGDPDMVIGTSLGRCDEDCPPTAQVRYMRNEGVGNWLQLDLRGGAGANRRAIGARVTIEAGGVSQTREIGGGYGHYGSQDDLVQTVGTGDACQATVTVRWPDAAGTTSTWTLPVGHRFTLSADADPQVSAP